jgi:D-alanyl-D-alanine carboxypeptidase
MRRLRLAGLLVVIAAIVTALGYQSLASSSWTASLSSTVASPIGVPRSADRGAPGEADGTVAGGTNLGEHRRAPGEVDGVVPGGATLGEHRRPLGEADGAVPSGTTVFDDGIPGVANLDSDLLGALRRAATGAANDGVEFVVDSGWRSSEYQEQLLRQAVSQYGSEQEAARWVATPKTSAHVSGDAVDIGPADAAAWLSEHGAQFGLCEIYDNEPWHHELRRGAIDHGCPPTYADAAHDPRLQQ